MRGIPPDERSSGGMKMDAASRALARQWMGANLLGAAVVGIGVVSIAGLGRLMLPDSPGASALPIVILFAMACVIGAVAMGLSGHLTGSVLGRRLADFPLRTWIAINAFIGLFYGVTTFLAVS